MPAVTVIVPIYNVEPYLEKCLDSLINQTLKDIEIICVNDGSTDNSPKIIKRYADKDSRIVVISQQNQGLSASRNVGIKRASSKYIMFLDSDDWLEPQALERSYDAIIKNNVDVVLFGVMSIAESQKFAEETGCYNKYYSKFEFSTGFYKFTGNFRKIRPSAWAKLYKKEIIYKYNLQFPVGLINEDEAFLWFYFTHIKNFYYINAQFYNRLVRENSIMTNVRNNNTNRLDFLFIMDIILDYLIQNKLYRKFRKEFTKWYVTKKEGLLKNLDEEILSDMDVLFDKIDDKINRQRWRHFWRTSAD